MTDRDAGPYGITTGPDDACWFTEGGGQPHRACHPPTGGSPATTCRRTPSSEPHGLTVGPDGALHVALEIGRVARIQL